MNAWCIAGTLGISVVGRPVPRSCALRPPWPLIWRCLLVPPGYGTLGQEFSHSCHFYIPTGWLCLLAGSCTFYLSCWVRANTIIRTSITHQAGISTFRHSHVFWDIFALATVLLAVRI